MFKMLKGIFGGEKEKPLLLSPVNGTAVPMSEVNDPTFAQEILGGGVAIKPSDGHYCAPCDGTVTLVFETKHAICMTAESGAELIIHIGLDTVKLGGEPFNMHVKNGDHVKAGDVLVDADLDAIRAKGYDVTTPIVVTNSQQYPNMKPHTGAVKVGDPLLDLA